MNYATIKSDELRFLDPQTGPTRMQELLRQFELADVDLEPGADDGTYCLYFADDASDKITQRLHKLAEAAGPLLQDAVEITLQLERETGGDGAGPFLFYAGASEEDRKACKMRHAVERASEQLEHVLSKPERDALFFLLQPPAAGASKDELSLRRQRAIEHAALTMHLVGESELADIVQRVAAEAAAIRSDTAAAEQPALWRQTYVVTVLTDGDQPVEFGSLQDIHCGITSGDFTGTWGALTCEPLQHDSAVQAVRDVGSDPGFFGLSEAEDEEPAAVEPSDRPS